MDNHSRLELKKRLRKLKKERKELEDAYFRSWFRGADWGKGIVYTTEYPSEEECTIDQAIGDLDFEIEQLEEELAESKRGVR
jgi:hypothetical protein